MDQGRWRWAGDELTCLCNVWRQSCRLGGLSGVANAAPRQMISLYDLKSGTWRDKFTPGSSGDSTGSGTGSVPDPTSGPTTDGGSGSNVGTIAGGVAATVISVAAILLLRYRGKQAAKNMDPPQFICLGDVKSKKEWSRSSPH